MPLPNIFDKTVSDEIVQRIEKLEPTSEPAWGRMDAAQMLAHCNVTYELVYTDKHPKPNFLMAMIIKLFVKSAVTNEVPYKHNSQTAPAFRVIGDRDFEAEKKKLISHIYKTQQLGEQHFDNLESHSFGSLNKIEWNNMFYKHIDHHLRQFKK